MALVLVTICCWIDKDPLCITAIYTFIYPFALGGSWLIYIMITLTHGGLVTSLRFIFSSTMVQERLVPWGHQAITPTNAVFWRSSGGSLKIKASVYKNGFNNGTIDSVITYLWYQWVNCACSQIRAYNYTGRGFESSRARCSRRRVPHMRPQAYVVVLPCILVSRLYLSSLGRYYHHPGA